MRARVLLVVFAALFAVACSDSSQEQAETTEPKVARWELDEDANVAVPVCPGPRHTFFRLVQLYRVRLRKY